MDITVNRALLADRLGQVAKAASGRIIPIADCVLIEATKQLSIICTDTQFSIKGEFEAEISKNGKVAVPADKLLEIIKKIGGDNVQLQEDDGRLLIKSGKSKVHLLTQPHEDFPQPNFNYDQSIKISKKDFEYLTSVKYAVSKSETTPQLTGINFSVSEGKLITIATDRHKLSKAEITLEEQVEEINATLPTNMILTALKAKSDEITLSFKGNQVFIKDTNYQYASSIIEGRFPEITHILKSDITTTLTTNINELIHKLELAEIAGTDQNIVKMDIKEKEIQIEARGELLLVEEVIESDLEGETLQISTNAKYMIEALTTAGTDTVIKMCGKFRPIIIDGDTFNVVMPYRTN